MSEDGRHVVLAVVDGRSTTSRGMRCDELGTLMKELGAHDAINLDGGGSTTMWMKSAGVLNSPSDGSERTVSNHLAIQAEGGVRPPEACPVAPDFDVEVGFLETLGGAGGSVPRVVEGDALQAELLFENRSARTMPDIIAGYWLESPYYSATDYTIQSDHPEHDRMTWTTSSADQDPDNPPKGELGFDGFLALQDLAPGETARVLVELTAERYSVGAVDHPDARAWIKHVPYIYGEQDAWN